MGYSTLKADYCALHLRVSAKACSFDLITSGNATAEEYPLDSYVRKRKRLVEGAMLDECSTTDHP